MFKIAICDDERLIGEEIEDILQRYQRTTQAEMTWQTFFTSEDLWQAVHLEQYDLIFLDIEMPGLDGISLGKKIRRELREQWTQIVFVTARAEHALEGYQARPRDFLTKPIEEGRIIAILDELLVQTHTEEDYFIYKKNGMIYRQPYREILYIASEGRKNRIILRSGEDSYNGSLHKVKEELASHGFIMIHQSFMVNLREIIAHSPTQVKLSNGEILPISAPHQQAVAAALISKKRKG